MAKQSFISETILFKLRRAFSGKRQIIADEADKHYNTVCLVLSGDLYNEKILTTMCDFLEKETESEELQELRKTIIKIIKKRQSQYVTAQAA